MWWLIFLALFPLIYWFINDRHKYWTRKGVKQSNPKFLAGDGWGTFSKTQSLADMVEMVYYQHPTSRYSGIYSFLLPLLVIRDPELIKTMTVKDFNHFVDHSSFIPEDSDPLWSKNLFALTGKKWRDMRATLSPAFTGSKIKIMFSIIAKNGQQFVEYFLQQKEDLIVMEMRDTFTRFANDVIANTAFGFECDSLRDRNNEFYLMGKEATDLGGFWMNVKLVLYMTMPKLFKHFNIRLFSKKVENFFTTIIKSNIKSREKHGIIRSDMLHLLMEARKNAVEDNGKKMELSDEDIAAQAMIFFFAGFDSVSGLMQFMSYELAINPEIQKKLTHEVDTVFNSCNGNPSYEAIMGMKYTDMVINETLRKWPNAVAGDRVCTKPYTIEPKNPDEKPVHLDIGDLIWIPIFSLQRDPKYFPDPLRFDPERFSEENKEAIAPYSFIAFGAGPRICIGSRFALLEVKILFFYILSQFQIVPVEKTQIPLRICKKQFSLQAEGGIWLGFKKRVKESSQ